MITPNPLVSIIITCYNYGRFVADAIDSALSQTYPNVEVIIVNDGSTDNSVQVIEEYTNNPKIVCINQANAGLVFARNNGIQTSKGEIILPLDADDVLDKNYVEAIVNNLNDYRTIVTTDVYLTDIDLNVIDIWKTSPTSYDEILKQNSICCSSGFSRKLFDEVGGYDPLLTRLGYEDWDLWTRMLRNGATVKLINSSDENFPFFKYRKHGLTRFDHAIKNRDTIMEYLNNKYIAENFYMPLTYKTNPEVYFDDTDLKDEWQNEVYEYAHQVCKNNNYKKIIDFGCGSAYKLIKYFNDVDTVGIDLPETTNVLKERYPNKIWKEDLIPEQCDIFIASDVIEHMSNPNILLDFIEKCNPKEIILSTPDRNLFFRNFGYNYFGPPYNKHHIREWTYEEFEQYIKSRFEIINHNITNIDQCTQMVHARMKN